MGIDTLQLDELIDAHYKTNHSELFITKNIKERIIPIITSNNSIYQVPPEIAKEKIIDFLEKPNILKFITERQPLLSKVPEDVITDVVQYFKKNLSGYIPIAIYRKSNHQDDAFMYSVLSQKEDTYACWTCWNQKAGSLNHGHTQLDSIEEAVSILKENFFDLTGEPDKYGIEHSCTMLENSQKEGVENQIQVENRIRKRGR